MSRRDRLTRFELPVNLNGFYSYRGYYGGEPSMARASRASDTTIETETVREGLVKLLYESLRLSWSMSVLNGFILAAIMSPALGLARVGPWYLVLLLISACDGKTCWLISAHLQHDARVWERRAFLGLCCGYRLGCRRLGVVCPHDPVEQVIPRVCVGGYGSGCAVGFVLSSLCSQRTLGYLAVPTDPSLLV